MQRTNSTAAILFFLTVLVLASAGGCTPSDSEPHPQLKPTAPGTVVPSGSSGTEKTEPKAAATTEAPKPLVPALADLKAKLQPPASGASAPKSASATDAKSATAPAGATKAEPFDGSPLLPAAEKLAMALAAALDKGNIEAATALCVSDEDLGKVLTPGYRDILAGSLLPQNKASFETYAGTVQGKGAKPAFKAGTITRSPAKGAFQPGLPIMSGAALVLDLDGVKVEVRLEQLVHFKDDWRIVRMGSP